MMEENEKVTNEAEEAVEETAEETAVTAEETATETGEAEEDLKEDSDKNKDGERKKSVGKEILSWVITIAAALIVAVCVNIYLIRVSHVNGKSMENTFHNGDTVAVSKLPYIFGDPEYGDVIIFDAKQIKKGERTFWDDYKDVIKYNALSMAIKKDGTLEHKYYIKRVIGVPGDVIEIKEDGLYVNGERIEETYIKDQNWTSKCISGPITVSEDCVFVMGDNRNNSQDSRYIGEISYDSILGKVLTKK